MSELGGKVEFIDGHEFDVGYLNTKQARRTWTQLVQKLGPSLDAFQDGDVGFAVTKIAEDPALADFFEELVQVFGKVTQIDGKPLLQVEARVFQGKVSLTLKWLKFALEVNYSDFLDLLQS